MIRTVGSLVRVELKRLSRIEALRTKTQWDLHATKGWRFYKKIKDVIPVDRGLVISIPCKNEEYHTYQRAGTRKLQVRP